MSKQQSKLNRQMKKNSDLLKVLKVTMQQYQAITAGNSSNIQCLNQFSALNIDSDKEELDANVTDDANTGMRTQVYERALSSYLERYRNDIPISDSSCVEAQSDTITTTSLIDKLITFYFQSR